MEKEERGIAVYSRKSRFTGKGESVGNQIEFCREYIRAHYGEAAVSQAEIFEDEGFSGGNLNRPGFQAMMELVRKRKFRAVIVYRLDRISRCISDFSGLIDELGKLDTDFVSIREQFDTGTPMGRAMMYIASVFSQLERETIAERIRDNLHELAKTGRWLGGNVPTGYRSGQVEETSQDGRKKRFCRLFLVPEEAETVKLVYRVFLSAGSLTKTESELMERGILTKNGKTFTRFSIKALLRNPVYAVADGETLAFFQKRGAVFCADASRFDGGCGILAYCRTIQEKGRTAVFLPVESWIVAVGQHPGLICGKDWCRVQEMLEENREKSFRRPRKNEALLTGLLFCSCGSRMYPKLTGRHLQDGTAVYTYVCRRKETSRRALCCVRNVSGNQLDRMALAACCGLREDMGRFGDCMKEASVFREGHRAGKAPGQPKKLPPLPEAAEDAAVRDSPEAFGRILSCLEECAGRMDIQQKRRLLKAVIQKAVWDGAGAELVLYGEGGAEKEIGSKTC